MSNAESGSPENASDTSGCDPVGKTSATGFAWRGIFFAALAALGYTLANAFLRQLSECVPHEWVVTCKASLTSLVFLPWLAFLAAGNRRILPPLKICGILLAAAVFVQLAGNLAFQWSLSQIGMALSVPILMSIMIISGAGMGWLILKEPVSKTMCIVIAVFVVAIFMLGVGAGEHCVAKESVTKAHLGKKEIAGSGTPILGLANDSIAWPILGALAAGLAGLAYGFLGVSVRISLRHQIPLATPMVFVGSIGVLMIGGFTYATHGIDIAIVTTGEEWFCLIGAAFCNTAAFLSLTMAFKLIPVVYVNITNVAQVAMAGLIGLLYFQEPFTIWLAIGLLLVAGGYLVLGTQPKSGDKKDPKPGVSSDVE